MREVWMLLGANIEMSTYHYRKLLKQGSTSRADLPWGSKITLDGDSYILNEDMSLEGIDGGVDVITATHSAYYPSKAAAVVRHLGTVSLWARLGCRVLLDDEQYKQLIASHDGYAVKLPNDVGIIFDGMAYFPAVVMQEADSSYKGDDLDMLTPEFRFIYNP